MQGRALHARDRRLYVELDPLDVAGLQVDHELELEQAAFVRHDGHLVGELERPHGQQELFQAVAGRALPQLVSWSEQHQPSRTTKRRALAERAPRQPRLVALELLNDGSVARVVHLCVCRAKPWIRAG